MPARRVPNLGHKTRKTMQKAAYRAKDSQQARDNDQTLQHSFANEINKQSLIECRTCHKVELRAETNEYQCRKCGFCAQLNIRCTFAMHGPSNTDAKDA